MNFELSREIYGEPWCIDQSSYSSLSSILANIRSGIQLELPEEKYNSCAIVVNNETRLISNDWQLDSKDNFDGIGLININGPITKGGGASSRGMIEISNSMIKMANDSRIKSFILNIDSGGGAASAIDIIGDTISEIKKTKPVYAFVPKGSMAGSAAYIIATYGTKIFSESEMNIVGSVGTMFNISSKKDNSESPDGTKNIVIYATKSTAKNNLIREAVNNDNYELIISELLDPINERMLSIVEQNRPQLKGTDFDNGHTSFAKDTVGTFIDGIASFSEVVEMLKTESINSNFNINNQNSSTMTKTELQSNHPELLAQITSEAVSGERERVKSFMVYQSADPEGVKSAIESGVELTPTHVHNFMLKMNANNTLEALKSDGAGPVPTSETPTNEPTSEDLKKKEIESAMAFKL